MIKSVAYSFLACALLVSTASAAGAPAKKDEDKNDKAAARLTGSQMYVAIPNLHATVMSNYQFAGVFSVNVGLEVKKEKQKDQIAAYMPRLRDALRGAVAAYVSRSYESGRVPDLDILTYQLQRATDRVLGKEVADVTISSALLNTQG